MNRNAYFDNAKLLLIFLVVFGHLIQPFTEESAWINTLYLWIYTFHMPAFIFLAGFFARGAGNKKYILNLTKKLLVPYLIFQVLFTGYFFLIGKSDWQTGIFYPHWSLWFLFSLFSWHILLYGFKKIPAKYGLGLSVVIGLIIGYFGEIGHTFSLSRTFVFFPFFLLGYWLTQDQVMVLKRRSFRIASIIVMAVVAAAIHIAPDIPTGWLLASKSYVVLLDLPEYGIIARSLVYVTATIMMASVLAWIPGRKGRLTDLGTRTLYVYLLHGFFIQYFRQANVFGIGHPVDIIGLAVIAAGIVFVLSSKPVLGLSQPLIEAKMSMLKNTIKQQRRHTRSNNLNT